MSSLSFTPALQQAMDFRAFEATPGISVVVLPDAPLFTHVAVSHDFIRASGMRKEDVIGKGHFEVFPKSPDDPNFTGEQNLRASFEHIIKHREPHGLPLQRYDIPNEDGTFSQKYWKISNAPIINDKGEVEYIVHSALDITDQVAAQKKAESVKGMEKAYHLFMNAPVIIAIVKGDNYVIELANKGMLQVWGRTEEVIGKPLLEAIPELEGQGFIELLDEVRKTGMPFHAYENPATLIRNGREEVLYFDFVYQPYYEDKEGTMAAGVIGVAHEVTEKVLARNKVEEVKERLNFRNALFEAQNEATPDGVLIVDAKGKMLLYNSRFVQIWSMPPEIIDSKDDEAALRHAMTMLADPQGFIDRVTYLYANRKEKSYDQILFRDGRIIERNGTPILSEEGFYYGWAWYFRDITDRIKQEQKFRNVVEQAPDPIFIFKGEDMVLEVANEALFRLWKVDSSAIGKPFLHILPEMKEQGFFELLQNVYRTGEAYHGIEAPVMFQEKDGKKRILYFNFTYQPYREVDGTITGVLVLGTDVTGQVMAKQQLVESERNLLNTILQAPVAMCFLKGPSFVVEVANKRMFELWGKGADEVMNKPIFEGLPEARNQGLEELLQQVYATGETFAAYDRPVQLLRNGKTETVYINFVYEPFRASDGTISGVMAVATEVTSQVIARKKIEESEARARLAVEAARLGTFEIDMARETINHSPRTAEIFGLDPLKQWPYKRFSDAIHPDDNGIRAKAHERAKQTGELLYEARILLPDGYVRWVRMNGKYTFQNHVPVSLIGTILDITEERKTAEVLEQKIEERTKELKQANEQLKQFTYAASHDLQEPLRKISFFLDKLLFNLGTSLNEENKRVADRIQHTAGRMRSLIDDLLSYSNTTLGVTEFKEMDLTEVINEVLQDMEASVIEKKAVIDVQPLPRIKGDERQLRQLFQNLVSNALKYHKRDQAPQIQFRAYPVKGEEVAASLSPQKKEKLFFKIEVRDNGIGFHQEDAERIFRLFQRLHGKAEYEGTGVGLAIVQKVLENHQGYITTESEPGKGAVFNVYLPA